MTNTFLTRLTALKTAANKKRKTLPTRVGQGPGDAKFLIGSGVESLGGSSISGNDSGYSGVNPTLTSKQVAQKRGQLIAKEKQKTQQKLMQQQQEQQRQQQLLQQKRAALASGVGVGVPLGAVQPGTVQQVVVAGQQPVIHVATSQPQGLGQQFIHGQKLIHHPVAGQSILQHQLSAGSGQLGQGGQGLRMQKRSGSATTISLQVDCLLFYTPESIPLKLYLHLGTE